MRSLTFVVAFLVTLVFPMLAVAQESAELFPNASGAPCTLTGTWIGASDPNYPYVWIFSPAASGRYTSVTQPGYDVTEFGYTTATDWLGEAARLGPGSWDSWGTSFWIWDPAAAEAAGVDASHPELEIVHSRIDMIDCDTITSTIDLWASYFAWTADRQPFIDPYDYSWLEEGQTLTETYRRLPAPTNPGIRTPENTNPEILGNSVVPKLMRRQR